MLVLPLTSCVILVLRFFFVPVPLGTCVDCGGPSKLSANGSPPPCPPGAEPSPPGGSWPLTSCPEVSPSRCPTPPLTDPALGPAPWALPYEGSPAHPALCKSVSLGWISPFLHPPLTITLQLDGPYPWEKLSTKHIHLPPKALVLPIMTTGTSLSGPPNSMRSSAPGPPTTTVHGREREHVHASRGRPGARQALNISLSSSKEQSRCHEGQSMGWRRRSTGYDTSAVRCNGTGFRCSFAKQEDSFAGECVESLVQHTAHSGNSIKMYLLPIHVSPTPGTQSSLGHTLSQSEPGPGKAEVTARVPSGTDGQPGSCGLNGQDPGPSRATEAEPRRSLASSPFSRSSGSERPRPGSLLGAPLFQSCLSAHAKHVCKPLQVPTPRSAHPYPLLNCQERPRWAQGTTGTTRGLGPTA